ncbi:MAG: tRNA guanosine(34) transglycosylase Tgt, partial [Chitinophagia bacterium]|nr:tRNA guanosine(34) transglycosylase Tgt [Chitinophagia bacterium]
PDVMKRAGTDIILSNLYHLMLQPGADVIEGQGGLHDFMRWQGPMLTDSGGYQVFAMQFGGISDEVKGRNKAARPNTVIGITEEGVTFQSYIDGRKILLTAESSMQLQRQLGADLIMAFDECTAFHHSKEYQIEALARSHRWGVRSLEAFTKQNTDGKQALYGIVQGAHYQDLREKAMRDVTDLPYFGTAVGGSFGKSKEDLYSIVRWCGALHKPERPVHLLGVGDIADIFVGIKHGIDTFDCVQPTRLGRHGVALMPSEAGGRLNLRNARFRDDKTPLDPEHHHEHTSHYTRGYLHHLIKAEEMLGMQILTEHNVSVMNRLMRDIRSGIRNGNLPEVEARWMANICAADA